MWRKKTLYEGRASGLFEHEHFVKYMIGKGMHLSSNHTPLRKSETYVLEATSTLVYQSWERVVPRGLRILEARITLCGYEIEEAEKNLGTLFTVESFE
ncbi:MAG TPA: hypothetical protein VJB13_00830 [Candidatus Nanoarchaeia archaeon]|nr:hypothetical protein [Candidatus Nanoarchaeia archaeon]